MKILYLIITALVCYSAILLCKRKHRSALLYTLAIGGVVNSNFFHAGITPIYVGSLPFGLDSIIYTLFVFCVMTMFLYEGKKQAYALLVSSLAAILFSALVQFAAYAAVKGWSDIDNLKLFATFLISIFASAVALVASIELAEVFRRKNMANWLNLTIGLIISTVLNSALYYGLSAWLNGGLGAEFALTFTASVIGKLIAIAFSIITYVLLRIRDQKDDRKELQENLQKEGKEI